MVTRAIAIIRSELDTGMAPTGVTSIAEIDRRVITAVWLPFFAVPVGVGNRRRA
jgi:isopentenyl diphosphate isomerase/L-lactate dehydrogenase-like FMN-dependent dehydrogenase